MPKADLKREKKAPGLKDREAGALQTIRRDLRARPEEFVEGWKVPKGGE